MGAQPDLFAPTATANAITVEESLSICLQTKEKGLLLTLSLASAAALVGWCKTSSGKTQIFKD